MQQAYLSPDASPNEGAPATGAAPAAHGVPHSALKAAGCQDSMQSCLECTRQTYKRETAGEVALLTRTSRTQVSRYTIQLQVSAGLPKTS